MTAKPALLKAVRLARERVPSFSEYPFNLPGITNLDVLEFHPEVTFLVGENGTGKSTLLEATAVALDLNAEGGSKNFAFSTRSSHSPLHDCIEVRRSFRRARDHFFLRAESYFNVATEIENLDREGGGGPPIISYYGGTSLHEQSHGESFLALFVNRLGGDGLYLFDEPESALSPMRQLVLLRRMHDLVKRGSQFIIATHSPILMAYPNARIYVLGKDGIQPTALEDTEHYRITRGFLTSPDRVLKELLDDPDAEASLFD